MGRRQYLRGAGVSAQQFYGSQYRHCAEVVAYTFFADVHCVACTVETFPGIEDGKSEHLDVEGNPVHPVFLGDEFAGEIEENYPCGTCTEKITI